MQFLEQLPGTDWDGIGLDGIGLYRGGLVCSSGPDAAFRQMCYLMDYADRA